jgi:hypothetical protein
MANRNFFNNTTSFASAHYIVDKNTIVQAIPDDEMAYNVGASHYTTAALQQLSSYPNNCTIGIEICNNDDWAAAVENGAQLATYLLKKYNLGVGNLWRHYDITGKICPAPMVNDPSQWDAFRNRVATILNPPVIPPIIPQPIPQVNAKDMGGTITVICPLLNVRSYNQIADNKIGELNSGQMTNVTGFCDNQWYRINYNGTVGYVSGNPQFVNYQARTIAGQVVNVRNLMGTVTVICDVLNIRSSNIIADNKIGELRNGQTAIVTGICDNEWYQIDYNGSAAYVVNNPQFVQFQS